MKKFVNYGLSLMLIASPFLITSCGETEPPVPEFDAPTLSIAGAPAEDETTVEIGETVSFKVNVTAPAGFNTIYYNKTVGSETTTRLEEESRPSGTAPTTFEYTFTYTAAEADAGKQIIFDFIAVDEQNQEGQATYTINVNEAAAIEEYETVLLGGQMHKTEKSFFNALDGVKLGFGEANDNPAKVDFVYYYQVKADGTGSAATIGAPADEPTRTFWANTTNSSGASLALSAEMNNETQFKRMPENYDYAAIVNASQVANAYLETSGSGDAGTRITNLEEGQSFAFKLDDARGARYGIVQVTDISGTDGSNRTITLEVKIQTEDNN